MSSSAIDHPKSKPGPPSQPSSPTTRRAKSNGEASGDLSPASKAPSNQIPHAGQNGTGAIVDSGTQSRTAPFAFLALAAETLEDIERARIAAENRARALVHPEQNIGLPPDDPHVALAEGIASEMLAVERRAEQALKRMLRNTPLSAWVKQTVGIGEKQAARLLGVIGDPRIRIDGETGEIHERTVGQLWSYCGYAVVPAGGHAASDNHRSHAPGIAPRRKRGEQGSWNAKARMRAYLIAESCMKSPTSPYRKLYEDGRAKYADSVHKVPCPQCGAKGKPAEVGSELRDGHKHARALRLVAKEMLKDLWLAAGQMEPSKP